MFHCGGTYGRPVTGEHHVLARHAAFRGKAEPDIPRRVDAIAPRTGQPRHGHGHIDLQPFARTTRHLFGARRAHGPHAVEDLLGHAEDGVFHGIHIADHTTPEDGARPRYVREGVSDAAPRTRLRRPARPAARRQAFDDPFGGGLEDERQHRAVRRAEVKPPGLLGREPAEFGMFERRRLGALGRFAVQEREVDRPVGIGMGDGGPRPQIDDGEGNLLAAFAHKRLLGRLAGFQLSPHELPAARLRLAGGTPPEEELPTPADDPAHDLGHARSHAVFPRAVTP